MVVQPFCWALAAFSVSWSFYTVCRTPWTVDQPIARPLPAHRTAQTQNKNTQTCLKWESNPRFQCLNGRRKGVREVINKAKLMGDQRSEVKWSELWLNVGKDLWQYIFYDCYCLVYIMLIFVNTTLYNCSRDCCIFILCRVFIVCVVLCNVFRLIFVLFYVMCVVCVLCLIVVPLPPGEKPFALKISNNNKFLPQSARPLCSTMLNIAKIKHNDADGDSFRSWIVA
jgi:hypothetical protein